MKKITLPKLDGQRPCLHLINTGAAIEIMPCPGDGFCPKKIEPSYENILLIGCTRKWWQFWKPKFYWKEI